MTENSEAKKLHKCLIIILEEIVRICDKHDIPVFLVGGTLLGAVRNGGIIPWDDDLDVGMLRPDYERFLKICETELDSKYVLCTNKTEKLYGKFFAKVRLQGTHFYEECAPQEINDGIFVDIFPLDKTVALNSKIGMYRKTMIHSYMFLLQRKCGYKMSNKKMSVMSTPLTILPKNVIVNRLNYWLKFFSKKHVEFLMVGCEDYSYHSDCFENLEKVSFERIKINIPKKAEVVLKIQYGNYLELPPLSERIFKHTESDIDYGAYL